MNEQLLEQLADLEHDQWAHWTKYFLENLTEENIARWKKQIETPYSELTEKEKESDRDWARKVLEIVFTKLISKEEMTDVKTSLGDFEADSEKIEAFKELRDKKEDSVSTGILYYKCYNFLEKINNEEIEKFLRHFKLEEDLISLVEEYNSDCFGKNYIGQRIKDYVEKNREMVNTLIKCFFEIFSEED